MCSKMASDIPSSDPPRIPFTGLPTCPELPADPDSSLQLGYFFANKPYSRLTPQHGFIAELQIPVPELPPGGLADDPDVIDNAARFRRFEKMKKEWHAKTRHKRVPVHCLIDETTSHTFASYSAVGIGEVVMLDEEEQLEWQLIIDNVFIPGKVLRGVAEICLLINERPHFISTWVMDELFPGHQVDIQIVLGRDFLRSCSGLVLGPVIRGQGSVDLVPWEYDAGGPDFEINSEGELIVYACGHSKQVKDPNTGAVEEKGVFGVFFGPNSNYNTSMQCTFEGSPQDETALMEGIICTVLPAILERWTDGPSTFTSVRVRIDMQGIVGKVGPKGMLQERGWEGNSGEIFQIWAESVLPQLEAGKSPWMKDDMIVFEQVGKEEKGIQAARYLTMSSLNSRMAEEIDRGAFKETVKEKWVGSLFTYIELLSWLADSGPRSYKLVRHPSEHSFIIDRKVASEKASEKVSEKAYDALGLESFQATQIAMSQFFPSKGIINIYTFWRSLEKAQFITAAEIFAISKQDFIDQVVEIGKERGRLMNNEGSGEARNDDGISPSKSGIGGSGSVIDE